MKVSESSPKGSRRLICDPNFHASKAFEDPFTRGFERQREDADNED
jgi:hypothetical protein